MYCASLQDHHKVTEITLLFITCNAHNRFQFLEPKSPVFVCFPLTTSSTCSLC